MIFKQLEDILSFEAGDKTILKEVLHSKNEDVTLPYSLAHAYLEKGKNSLPHVLKNSDELYLFTSGEGLIIIDDQQQAVKKGSVVLVPKGTNQYVKNTGNERLTFFCIVSPPWKSDEEEISE